ncbi:MFS transporter, partial [Actinacidiphila rubida]
QAVSQCGTQVSILALPFTALQTLNATTFQISALQAVQIAPYLVIGLPAGAWVDRLPLRHVLVWSDTLRAAALLTVPLAWAAGALTLAHLYTVALAVGIATVFFDVAYQSYLPDLVAADELAEGNAQLELARSTARVLGPGLGGWLIAVLRGPLALSADALSFLVSALTIPRTPTAPSRADADGPRAPLRHEVGEGLRFVRRHRVLAPVTATAGLLNLSYGMTFALLVTFGSRQLGLSPREIGLVTALGSAGFGAGALCAPRVLRAIGTGPTMVCGAAVAAAGALGLPAAMYGYPRTAMVAGLFVQWFGVVLFNVTQVSLRQSVTPRALMTRMNATVRFVVWGMLSVGALCGGALAAWTGLPTAMWISAAAGAPAFLLLLPRAVRAAGGGPGPPAPDGTRSGRDGDHAPLHDQPSHDRM